MLDDTIRYTVAVARQGSFTAAALHVGLTQSAITKRVAELEQRLGYALFRRTTRGVILTDEGIAFVDRAARVLEDVDHLMSRNREPYVGPLRIGVCPAALDGLLLKPIAELTRRYRQVQLDISSSSLDRMMHQLRNGRVDVVLGLERAFRPQADFSCEPLGAVEAIYFARRGHPLEQQKQVPGSALAAFDFVLPSEIAPYTQNIREFIQSVGVSARSKLHAVDYFPLVKVIVSQSDAIGVVSASYTDSSAFKANFTIIDAIEPPPFGDLCWAVRARWDVSPIVKAFIQACRATLAPLSQINVSAAIPGANLFSARHDQDGCRKIL